MEHHYKDTYQCRNPDCRAITHTQRDEPETIRPVALRMAVGGNQGPAGQPQALGTHLLALCPVPQCRVVDQRVVKIKKAQCQP